MTRKKPEYPQEFRRQAVEMWRHWDGTQNELAKQLGICSRTIRRWLRRAEASEVVAAARNTGAVPLRDLEVQRLKRENAQLKESNAALQESVRFLAARRRSKQPTISSN